MVHRIQLLAVLVLLLAATAWADDKPATPPGEMFAAWDTNKDGQLTREEIAADKQGLFDRLVRLADKDGDGKLKLEEFTAGIERKTSAAEAAAPPPTAPEPGANRPERPAGPPPEQMFKRLDANGDGKVTLDEVPEPRRKNFERLIARGDKDGDKGLNMKEFVRAQEKIQQILAKNKGKKPDKAFDPAKLFRRADSNGDGKLTMDEVPEERRAGMERVFARAGKKPNESLTLEEFAAGMKRPPLPAGPPRGGSQGKPPRGGLFLALDTDQDGKLSSTEVGAAADVLKKLDKNGDASITPDELPPPEPPRP